MNALIDAAFSRSRVVVIAFLMILITGAISYISIPKESTPEIPIPMVFVSVGLEGISPQDAVTSLLKPMEAELSSVEGLKSLESQAYEGGGSLTLEFDAGFDSENALDDVREAVDKAKVDLPTDATEPVVREINTALFPIMTVIISGPVPERTLGTIAEDLADRLEVISGVLEVDIAGKRDEVVEILIDQVALETYGLSFNDIGATISQNNKLVAAGALDSGDGRLVMKLPGLITSASDILNIPVKVDQNSTVTFSDVASVRRTFVDPQGYARLDGKASISLEIKKKSGANIIETTDSVRAVIDAVQPSWPGAVSTTISRDESEQVKDMLGDLEDNVIAAIIVVMIVILFFLGVKSSLLVGLSIPGSFLSGVGALWMSGYTMNIIVLFGLILVTGMLVDGAIVVIEYADRRIREGVNPKEAFSEAAKRMAWPIIASTATTLSVFLPLLFWQGMIGEFMKFLPITVLMTLTASLFMALIFIPVLGGVFSRTPKVPKNISEETEDPRNAKGIKRLYVGALQATILHPKTTLIILVLGMVSVMSTYQKYGNGVEFFPASEPDFAQVQVMARDNLSITGRDRLLREVEDRLIGHPHIKSIYARSSISSQQGAADQIGTVQIEFTDWMMRPAADEIMAELRSDLQAIPGLNISLEKQESGPASGKPIALEVVGEDAQKRSGAIDALISEMDRIGDITDISDTRSLPGVDYQIRVNREEASRFGVNIDQVGQAVRLLTTGITVSEFRPGDTGDSIDIKLRVPGASRTLDAIRDLRIPTAQGSIPISNFVDMEPVQRSGTILRLDGETLDQVEAGVGPGALASEKVASLTTFLDQADFEGVEIRIKGEAEDQAEAMIFLAGAFGAAIILMLMILVTQFNSLSQALLVLSAIVFSVAGVFLGLVITGRPFGVVMGGIGIIALAGIVVNNNIVLIDAYNEKRRDGWLPLSAALMTGSERLRPVLLTSVTTIFGLVPMALAMSIDIASREITFGAPSTLMWVDLSVAIVGGLAFATALTLLVTPAALVIIDRRGRLTEIQNSKHRVGRMPS
jgi:multidrug efflux pump